MKTFFISIALIFTQITFAQLMRVKEGNMSTSKGSQNSLSIEIPFVDEAFFQDELKSFLKDWGKCKENKGEYSVLLGEWKEYGKKTFDVYAK
ncbi:MAG: hypothetical protein ACOVNZ_07925, partial [Crocinitomicaceae bacterium]